MAENTYNPYPVGMTVYDVELGEGKVVRVNSSNRRPIVAEFGDVYEIYFIDGRRKPWGAKMLYTKPVQIVEIP